MSQLPVPEFGGEKAISQTDGRLAWELASDITPVSDLLTRYGISLNDFKKKLKDPMFRGAIREAKSIWKSELNTQQRIRVKAALMAEDSLLDVFAIVKNESQPAAMRLEAFEKLLKSADLVPKAGSKDQGNAGAFKINIILGSTPAEQVVINGHTQESLSAPE
ncbi:MAG: hypothetical protein ACHQ9S_18775 [Candidatus Binatia bacterium]